MFGSFRAMLRLFVLRLTTLLGGRPALLDLNVHQRAGHGLAELGEKL